MTMDTQSHHATAQCLKARQRLLEQADRLIAKLATEMTPALSDEDRSRVERIQSDLSFLYSSAKGAFDENTRALHELRGEKLPTERSEVASVAL